MDEELEPQQAPDEDFVDTTEIERAARVEVEEMSWIRHLAEAAGEVIGADLSQIPCPRVRYARNKALVAIYERLSRVARSDVGAIGDLTDEHLIGE